MDEQNKSKKLTSSTISLIVGTALFFDVLQWFLAFLFLGWIVVPLAYLTFFVWFATYKIRFFTSKRGPSFFVGILLEFVSGGILPSITYNVVRVILDNKVGQVIDKAPGGTLAQTEKKRGISHQVITSDNKRTGSQK